MRTIWTNLTATFSAATFDTQKGMRTYARIPCFIISAPAFAVARGTGALPLRPDRLLMVEYATLAFQFLYIGLC